MKRFVLGVAFGASLVGCGTAAAVDLSAVPASTGNEIAVVGTQVLVAPRLRSPGSLI